jgi:hypothetical protein
MTVAWSIASVRIAGVGPSICCSTACQLAMALRHKRQDAANSSQPLPKKLCVSGAGSMASEFPSDAVARLRELAA